ncbi:MAG: OmpA family protein [Candidatus Omnitrophica bacterium]|nr:OmpA family protein [Candidatus Omnitrophota bacterium]
MKTKKYFLKFISVLFVTGSLFLFISFSSQSQNISSQEDTDIFKNKDENITPLEYEILMFEKRTNKLIDGIEHLLKKMETVNSENIDFSNKLSEKDNYIEDMEGRLFKNKDTFDEAKGELSGYRDQIDNLKSSLKVSEEKTRGLLDELESKNRQLASNMPPGSENYKDAQIIALNKDNENYRKKAAQYLATIRELQTELAVKEREHQKLQDKSQVYDKRLDERAEEKVDLLAKKTNQIITLEEKIAKLESNLESKQEQINTMEKKLQAKETAAGIKSEEAETQAQGQALASRQEQINDLLVESKITIDKLKADLKAKEKELAEAANKLAYFERSESKSETAKDRLIKEREEALQFSKIKRDELQTQIDEYKEIIEKYKQEIKDKEAENKSLTSENQSLLAKKNDLLRAKEIDIQEMAKKTQDNLKLIDEQKLSIKSLEQAVKEKDKELAQVKKDINSQLKNAETSVEKKDELLEYKIMELKNLRATLEELNKLVAKKMTAIEELESAVKLKDKEIASLKDVLDSKDKTTSDSIAKKDQLLADKDNELTSLRNKLTELNILVAKQSDAISALESDIKNKDKELASKDKDLNTKQTSLSSLLSHKDELLEASRNEIKSLKENQSLLDKDIVKHLGTIKELKAELENRDKSIALLQTQIDSKLDIHSDLSEKLKNLDKQIASLKDENAKTLQENKQLKELSSQQKKLVSENANQLSDKDKMIAELKEKISAREKELLSETTQRLNAKDKIIAELKDMISAQEKDLTSDSAAKLKAKDEAISDLKNRLSDQEKNIVKEFNSRLEDKEKLIARLQEQLSSEKDKYLSRNKDLASAGNEKDTLISERDKQINDLRLQLQEVKNYNRQLNNELKSQRSKFIADKKEMITASPRNAGALKDLKEYLDSAFSKEASKLKTTVDIENEKVTVSVLTDDLFDSGSNELKDSSKPLMEKLARVFKSKAGGYSLIIEGHTDSEPIRHSHWKSNWELSSARALSVLHFFINECSFDPSRISFGGYGEQRPIASNNTRLGRQKNRRVDITLVPEEITRVKKNIKIKD